MSEIQTAHEIVSEFESVVRDRLMSPQEGWRLAGQAIDRLDDLSIPESQAVEFRRRIQVALQIAITSRQ